MGAETWECRLSPHTGRLPVSVLHGIGFLSPTRPSRSLWSAVAERVCERRHRFGSTGTGTFVAKAASPFHSAAALHKSPAERGFAECLQFPNWGIFQKLLLGSDLQARKVQFVVNHRLLQSTLDVSCRSAGDERAALSCGPIPRWRRFHRRFW